MGRKKSKVKVEIHVAKPEHIRSVSYVEAPFKQAGIKYSVVVDKRTRNIKYPYITVNNRHLCLKRSLNAARGRT